MLSAELSAKTAVAKASTQGSEEYQCGRIATGMRVEIFYN